MSKKTMNEAMNEFMEVKNETCECCNEEINELEVTANFDEKEGITYCSKECLLKDMEKHNLIHIAKNDDYVEGLTITEQLAKKAREELGI